MADASAFGADLAESGGAKIAGVDSDHGRTFGAAVAFERTNAEAVLESESEGLGQFFGADNHELQAAEIFGQAAARVGLQETWEWREGK